MNELYQKRRAYKSIGNTPCVAYTRRPSVYNSSPTLGSYSSNLPTVSFIGKHNNENYPVDAFGYRIKPLSRFFQNFQASVSDYMISRNGRSWIENESEYLRKKKKLIKHLLQKGMKHAECFEK